MIKRNYFISYKAYNSENTANFVVGYRYVTWRSLFDESVKCLNSNVKAIRKMVNHDGYDVVHILAFNRC